MFAEETVELKLREFSAFGLNLSRIKIHLNLKGRYLHSRYWTGTSLQLRLINQPQLQASSSPNHREYKYRLFERFGLLFNLSYLACMFVYFCLLDCRYFHLFVFLGFGYSWKLKNVLSEIFKKIPRYS